MTDIHPQHHHHYQHQKILAYLKQGKTITQAEAIKLCNCYRLSAIINFLRNKGHYIVTHFEPNGFNSGTHARYEYRGLKNE